MKLSAGQLQNILFTAIVACAAVGLYLLSGRSAQPEAQASPTPEAAAETEAPEGFASVPEEIYLTNLLSNTDFRKEKLQDRERAYRLVYRAAETGEAELSYTLTDGVVSSVTFLFAYRDKPPAKPKTEIEQRLLEDYPAFIAAQNEAILTMLPAVLSACDLNGVLIEPVLLRWYAGAISAREEGKNYTDAEEACTFTAYPTKLGERNVVICSLLLP